MSIHYWWLAGILVLGAIAHFPVLQADFINFDDHRLIIDNPIVNGQRDASAILDYWILSPHYKPLVFLTWKIEYLLAGSDPFLYHLDNLVLHLFNIALVFFLLLRITPRLGIPDTHKHLFTGVVTLIFALHPLHVESVAWASERKDVLYAFFFLSSLLLYVKYLDKKKKPGIWLLAGSSVLFGLAGLSKSMAITLPALLFLMDWLYERPLSVKLLVEKTGHAVVFVILAFLYGLLSGFSEETLGLTAGVSIESQAWLPDVLAAMPEALSRTMIVFTRLGLWFLHSVVPVNASLIYPRNEILQAIGFGVLLFPVLIGGLLWVVCRVRKRVPGYFWGYAWFLILMIPALAIDDRLTSSFLADRYVYLAVLGIIATAVLFLWKYTVPHRKRMFYGITGGVAVVFAVSTFNLSTAWQNSETIWTRASKVCTSCPDAWLNKGVYAFNNQDYDRAISGFNHALQLNPKHTVSLKNRAKWYVIQGQYDKALADLDTAMTSGKYTGELLSLKAGILLQMGNPAQALSFYNRAEQLEYRSPSMLQNRGTIYYARGDYADALSDFLDAYEMNATDGKLLMNIALSYKALGNEDDAQRFYEMAMRSGEQFPGSVLRAFR